MVVTHRGIFSGGRMQKSFLASYRIDADGVYCIGGQIQMCELFPLFLSLTVPQTAERALSLWPVGSASCANRAHSCNNLPQDHWASFQKVPIWCVVPRLPRVGYFSCKWFQPNLEKFCYWWDSFISGVGSGKGRKQIVSGILVLHLETQWDIFDICGSNAHCTMCSYICTYLFNELM